MTVREYLRAKGIETLKGMREQDINIYSAGWGVYLYDARKSEDGLMDEEVVNVTDDGKCIIVE